MELLEKAKLINLKDYELSEFETTLKRYRDNKDVLDSAKLEGKIEEAILSKKEGLPISLISKITGLSEKEIEELE